MEEELKELADKLNYKIIKKNPKINLLNKFFLFSYIFSSILFISIFSIPELTQYITINPEKIKLIKLNLWKLTFLLGMIGTFYIYILKRFKFTILLDGFLFSSFLMLFIGIKEILGGFGIYL